jgi:hypothetical protein
MEELQMVRWDLLTDGGTTDGKMGSVTDGGATDGMDPI